MAFLRRPAVAGSFYAGLAEDLNAEVESCFLSSFGPGKLPEVNPDGKREILGLICPHAGYEYSGPVAAHAYFSLASDGKPDIVVIMGPNHRGLGNPLSAMNEGAWQTPLGNVEIDSEVAEALAKETGIIDFDEMAHFEEHSVEVQLPFLQYLYGDKFKFVPLSFLMQDLETAMEVGRALTEVLANRNAVVIASSDFTHYESQANVDRKDAAALKTIETLDEKQFYNILATQHVSACGVAPIAALMTYAKGLGAKKAQVLKHLNSGDVKPPKNKVVGYAAVDFKKKSA